MKRKHVIFLITGLSLACGIFSVRMYNKWYYKKYQANIEENHDVMKYFVDDSVAFVRTAFTHLESQFPSPNDFNLNSYSIRNRDTIVNGIIDTVYSVYFTYFLTNSKQEKLSKVTLFNNQAQLDFFNKNVIEDDEFLSNKQSRDKQVKKTMTELKDFMDSLPPERRKGLTDTINSLLRE
jgi:hypothetical protein